MATTKTRATQAVGDPRELVDLIATLRDTALRLPRSAFELECMANGLEDDIEELLYDPWLESQGLDREKVKGSPPEDAERRHKAWNKFLRDEWDATAWSHFHRDELDMEG
jgi:hypothetical protein